MSTDRASALRAFRPPRTEGLPPPPVRAVPAAAPAVEDEPEAAAVAAAAGEAIDPVELAATGVSLSPADTTPPAAEELERVDAAADVGSPPDPSDDQAEGEGPFTFRALIERPQATCKAMTDERLQQPSKPLNVNIAPATAEAFDEQCRALRLKKKDVVEVLLRAWLASSAGR